MSGAQTYHRSYGLLEARCKKREARKNREYQKIKRSFKSLSLIPHLASGILLLAGVGEHSMRVEAVPKGAVDFIEERMLA